MECRRGPATVSASESAMRPCGRGVMSLGETLGRRRGAMTWSQENCLIDDRRKELSVDGSLLPASDGDGDSADTFRAAINSGGQCKDRNI